MTQRRFLLQTACAFGVSALASCGAPLQSHLSPATLASNTILSLAADAMVPFAKDRHPNRRPSWIDPAAQAQNLLYVTDIGREDVDILTYPRGKLVGQLTGFAEPNGSCVDGAGDVFVTNTYKLTIDEYAHGGTKPIAKLAGTGGALPVDCAIDPLTGNLAVADKVTPNGAPGNVAVYTGAAGQPSIYSGTFNQPYSVVYDDSGNLFLVGTDRNGQFELAELKSGGTQFAQIILKNAPSIPSAVKWDGQYLIAGDQRTGQIFQISVTSSGASVVNTFTLNGTGDIAQFWKQGNRLIVADARNEFVGYWSYPPGGDPAKSFTGFDEPVGVSVSLHSTR